MNSVRLLNSDSQTIIAPGKDFCLQMDKQTVILKKGLSKHQVIQLLGTQRCVDIAPDCQTETWSYCLRTKTKTAYCSVIFKDGSLADFRIS